MGILDDAIREHLDLKRRRGADPTEIERAEQEALGPVRRNYQAGDEPAEPGSEAVEEAIYDGDEEHWSEPVPEGPVAGAGLPPSEYDDLGATPAPGHWDDEDPFASHEPPAPAPPPPGVAPELEEETSEYDVPAAQGAEAEDEDVLEETPEFLQDTPEHDRLWFEQRPPRDFDFDG